MRIVTKIQSEMPLVMLQALVPERQPACLRIVLCGAEIYPRGGGEPALYARNSRRRRLDGAIRRSDPLGPRNRRLPADTGRDSLRLDTAAETGPIASYLSSRQASM